MNVVIGTMRNGCVETLKQPRLFATVIGSRLSMVMCSSKTDLPTVAAKLPFRVKLTGRKKYAWCACGLSKRQPFCDGTHRTNAPSISPVLFTPEKDCTVMLCACKHTNNAPYCDGTHFKVIFQHLASSVKNMFK